VRDALVLGLFAGVAALYAHPIFGQIGTHLVVDPGDPALNAAVLWWNATHVPLTAAWWNQPWFHPAPGVTALTENLLGLAPIASPLYWLTASPVVTYNLTLFATWPLSALAAYFLVRRLTGRTDAAVVAGFAFGFAPFRVTAELSHLQSLCAYGLPVALGSLHAYFDGRRPRWLAIFGVAWVLQSLSNGYYMLFGAVLIGLWLVYFGSTARTWRAAAHVAGAWVVASLPLVPVIGGYLRIHEHYGLTRTFDEAVAFSARPESWFQAPGIVALWNDVLPPGQHPFFPGLTVLLLVAGAFVAGVARSGAPSRARLRAALQAALAAVAIASILLLAVYFVNGPWSFRRGGTVWFKMSDPYRALMLLALCALPLIWIVRPWRWIASRSPLVFYTLTTVIMAVLACGPMLIVRDQVVFEFAPYRWLMVLPGFDGLRVPSRFWMMGVLSLSVAAGLGFAAVAPARGIARYLLAGVAAVGILADGWLTALPLGRVPDLWTSSAGSSPALPLLEFPIGPRWDSRATLRATTHGHRLFNGVSGYEPAHYPPLGEGLRATEPEMLSALASLGAFEVCIEHLNDPEGKWKRYVMTAPGAVVVHEDDARVIWRVPASTRSATAVGPALPIQSVRSHRGEDVPAAFDRRTDTDWGDGPQHPGQWLLADLGRVNRIGGVSLAITRHSSGFPRRVVVEVSADGERFEEAWQGDGAAPTFLAALRSPRDGWLRAGFASRDARFVRLRQAGRSSFRWIVPELEINAPVK
jgi:hypothetical protein